jgi:glycine cleavage system H protein
MDPHSLRFSRTHEWVHLDGDTATIGISDFAVQQLTDLVYIELPDAGRSLRAGEAFGVVESVKAASDLYAPLAGTVTAANTSLADDLGVLSEDPFGRGWMVKLHVADPSAVDSLLDYADYQEHCRSEAH